MRVSRLGDVRWPPRIQNLDVMVNTAGKAHRSVLHEDAPPHFVVGLLPFSRRQQNAGHLEVRRAGGGHTSASEPSTSGQGSGHEASASQGVGVGHGVTAHSAAGPGQQVEMTSGATMKQGVAHAQPIGPSVAGASG